MIKLLPLCKTFTLILYSCKLSACYFKTFFFKVHSFLRKRLDKGHGICLETTFANLLVVGVKKERFGWRSNSERLISNNSQFDKPIVWCLYKQLLVGQWESHWVVLMTGKIWLGNSSRGLELCGSSCLYNVYQKDYHYIIHISVRNLYM